MSFRPPSTMAARMLECGYGGSKAAEDPADRPTSRSRRCGTVLRIGKYMGELLVRSVRRDVPSCPSAGPRPLWHQTPDVAPGHDYVVELHGARKATGVVGGVILQPDPIDVQVGVASPTEPFKGAAARILGESSA